MGSNDGTGGVLRMAEGEEPDDEFAGGEGFVVVAVGERGACFMELDPGFGALRYCLEGSTDPGDWLPSLPDVPGVYMAQLRARSTGVEDDLTFDLVTEGGWREVIWSPSSVHSHQAPRVGPGAIKATMTEERWVACGGQGFDGAGRCPNLTPDPSGVCVTHRMVVGAELLAAQAEVRARRAGLPPGQLLARDAGGGA